jgi:hypothetical protein
MEKFTREYQDYTGKRIVWSYDSKKNPQGPFSVEIFYPKGYDGEIEDDPTNEKLPKTKRKYLNPENGKLVGYTRAKALGLID